MIFWVNMRNTNVKITKKSKWNVNRTLDILHSKILSVWIIFSNLFESSFIVFIYSIFVLFFIILDWTDSIILNVNFLIVSTRIECVFIIIIFIFIRWIFFFLMCFVVKFCWTFKLFTYHNFSSTQHHSFSVYVNCDI